MMSCEVKSEGAKEADLEQVRKIVRDHPVAKGNLALLGDKKFFFNEMRTSFVMYGVRGRSWIALGDPIGPPEEAPDLIRRFYQAGVEDRARPVFYEVCPGNLSVHEDLGLHPLKIAEEGRVPLTSFSLAGSGRRNLRNSVRKAEKEGCAFEWVTAAAARMILPELRAVSDAWLTSKDSREKRFSVGCFDENYLNNFSVGAVRQNRRIIAFATLWAGTPGEELYLDLMRSLPDVPRGTMDLLFVRMMERAQEKGYSWFNLGMSPLSGPVDRTRHPIWGWARGRLRRYGEKFYNTQGLRKYKEKFDPRWTPRYLAAPRGLALVRAFIDVAALTSGGLRWIVFK